MDFQRVQQKRGHFSRRFTKINGTKFTFESVCEKEFKTLFRTPQFFLNCIVQTFVMPIMLFFVLFVQDGNLKWITSYINNPKSAGLAIGVGLCASLFLMGSNVIATTSFSRDGSSWFVNRYLPVKASDIFLQSNHAWLINVIILAVFGITMAVVAEFLLFSCYCGFTKCERFTVNKFNRHTLGCTNCRYTLGYRAEII